MNPEKPSADGAQAGTLGAYLERHALERPGAVFLVAADDGGREVDFGTLRALTDEVGERLAVLGAARGAKVAFLLDNGLWATVLFLGTIASARVVVPLNAVAGDRQLRYVLEHSDAEVVFVAERYRERIDALLEGFPRSLRVIETDATHGPRWPAAASSPPPATPPRGQDAALLLYTSGTTGLPKGAVLSQRAIARGGENVAVAHGLDAHDRALCVLPIYHINGAMVTVAAPLVSGGSVVMPRRFSANRFWPLVSEHGCTWSSLVPTIIKYLLDRADQEPFGFGDDPRLARFRFARSASAALAAATLAEWEARFHVPMIETMGLTETAGTVLSNPLPPGRRKPGSVGRAYGNEARIVDERGRVAGPGGVGELQIRGENLLSYYYENPAATEAAFDDGWFRTGDLGYCDTDGYYFITGRLKELIIRGGENIAPREIDDVLYQHEAVLEAAAVGVPDEFYGQEVVACVALRDGYRCSEEELRAFCARQVGDYKAPKRVYFLAELPKGPSGKIQRLKLPELIGAQG